MDCLSITKPPPSFRPDLESQTHRASTRRHLGQIFSALDKGQGLRQLKRRVCDWHGWATGKNCHEIGGSGHLSHSPTSTWAIYGKNTGWSYRSFMYHVQVDAMPYYFYRFWRSLPQLTPRQEQCLHGEKQRLTFKLAHSNLKTKNWANFLSWTVAMYLFVSHIIFQMEDAWQLAIFIMRLTRLVFPQWTFGTWHIFMISAVNLIISGAFMLLPVSRSPRLWIGFAALTATLSATICIVLLSTSNFHQSPVTIFTHLENQSQIKSNGWAFLLGASSLAAAGAENSAHMAEETHEAELIVPRAMFFATLINYTNVLVVQICCYVSFSDANTFHQPSMPSLVMAHCSRRASACIFICLLIVTWIQQMSQLLASTRFVWALARDNAFPFATLWRKLSPKSQMPRRATILLITVTIVITCFLCLSSTHITVFIWRSDSYLSLMCYVIPVVLYLFSDKDVLYRDGRNFWTLQQWSRPLASLALITLLIQMILGGFPTDPKKAGPQFPVRAVSSASIPLVALMAIISWFLYGRAHYVGPIKSITVWTTGQEVELPRAGEGMVSNPTSTEEAVGRRANVFEESIPLQVTSGSHPRSENLASANLSISITSVIITAYPNSTINSIETPEPEDKRIV
ncbi:hypothetical protein VP01_1785g3 [Puccinia sorghi]|uniref:Uncharacterized protein n=1 Tax=Puccinia sorghi TaxID=27349 RepID=A0A0L6VEJ1_9BASI|nr:hypothetical protein VP01_1785g3 [Puccinia sorghi]